MEKHIAELMKALNITEAEARELIADDERIDKGEKLFELSDDQKANSKKARGTGTRVQKNPVNREHKEDPDKRELIQTLRELIAERANNPEVTNPERQIDFTYKGRKFRIVLSAPRS